MLKELSTVDSKIFFFVSGNAKFRVYLWVYALRVVCHSIYTRLHVQWALLPARFLKCPWIILQLFIFLLIATTKNFFLLFSNDLEEEVDSLGPSTDTYAAAVTNALKKLEWRDLSVFTLWQLLIWEIFHLTLPYFDEELCL